MSLLFLAAIVATSLALLIWSADTFIDSAANIAHHFNAPHVLVGIILLGFGTSAPEMVVSTFAALEGSSGIAVGNVIGSNIANIALVLAISAMIVSIHISTQVMKRELILVIITTILGCYLLWDQELDTTDGVILLAGFIITLAYIAYDSIKQHDNNGTEKADYHTFKTWGVLLLSFCTLLASARLLVYGSSGIASYYSISEAIIGITVVAIGTSLPELAVCISSALKKQPDFIIGNILGSNLFNVLAVLAIPGLLTTTHIESSVIYNDLPVMLGITFLLGIFSLIYWKSPRITRWQGAVLLLIYIGYMTHIALRTLH